MSEKTFCNQNGNHGRVNDADLALIKLALKEIMDDRMQEFFIERETHYQDHQFLKGLKTWSDGIKSTTMKTAVAFFVTALIGLLVLGFIMWGKKNIGH